MYVVTVSEHDTLHLIVETQVFTTEEKAYEWIHKDALRFKLFTQKETLDGLTCCSDEENISYDYQVWEVHLNAEEGEK